MGDQDISRTLYLELLKQILTGALHEDSDRVLDGRSSRQGPLKHRAADALGALLARAGLELIRKVPYDPARREKGLDRPGPRAESMIGLRRMDNIQYCVENVLNDNIPGDLIETGAWRGGATIFMRAILKAHGDTERRVWVADSFEGLPKPNEKRYVADTGDSHYLVADLRVGVEQVKENFRRYGLLDDQVKFLVGWFKDTLPTAPIDRLAVARLDGDMYESTIQAIEATYPKLSPGGFCIVDDYGNIPACKRATHDFRDRAGITDEIIDIDGSGVFWRKSK
ncbi:MAG: macrocin O-methyltransferase [Pseudonocardiales bacterium]|nr:MAG: macrocin O-methyltransferase [Pseudonocardiales bacterium]